MWSIRLILSLCLGAGFGYCKFVSYDYGGGYMSDLGTDWSVIGSRINPPKCIDIPSNLTLCANIGYPKMRLPNLLDHDSLAEVTQQARSWVPLLGIHCHPDTKLFLCSLFSPVCLDRPIYPCRSLCEGVKRGCEERMNWYGFPWPDMVKCDKFPLDSDLCIPQVNTDNKSDANKCIPCNQPNTFEGIIDNFCRAQYVIKTKIRRIRYENNDKHLILKKKKKFLKKESLTKADRKILNPYIQGGVQCECDYLADSTQTRYMIMGQKEGNRFLVTSMRPWVKSKEFKRALRAMRKGDVCKVEILSNVVTDNESTNTAPTPEQTGNRRKGRKNKKGKKKKKRKNRKNPGGRRGSGRRNRGPTPDTQGQGAGTDGTI